MLLCYSYVYILFYALFTSSSSSQSTFLFVLAALEALLLISLAVILYACSSFSVLAAVR